MSFLQDQSSYQVLLKGTNVRYEKLMNSLTVDTIQKESKRLPWHVTLSSTKQSTTKALLFVFPKVSFVSAVILEQPSQSSPVEMVASRISLSSFWVRFLIGGLTVFALWVIYTRLITEDSASVGFKEVRYVNIVRKECVLNFMDKFKFKRCHDWESNRKPFNFQSN